ncbi:MAG TPA: alpha/beta hydrolase [Bacillales bacterium]|nr:alpha/beta hydrolase [Bacillales bacterium]
MWKWEAETPKGVFVIVHGSGEHHGRYEWLIEKCRKNGFHVVMGDLPGYGAKAELSGHIDSFDEYIDSVSKWVKAAENFQLPIFIIGHSLGGLAVIRTLTEKKLPVTAAILSSPCLGLVHPPPGPLKVFSRLVDFILPKLRVRLKKDGRNPLATRNKERLKKDAKDKLIGTSVSIRWYNELDKAIAMAQEKIKEFPNVPLLVLQAGDDKIVDKNDVFKWFQQLPVEEREYKEWDGLYHEIFNEPEREQVFQYMLDYVNCLLEES